MNGRTKGLGLALAVGGAVAVAAMVEGCTPSPGKAATSPTPSGNAAYYPDVATIVNENCRSCHTAGAIASTYAFDTYDQAKALAPLMKTYTAQKLMPPFPPDDSGTCHTWKDARTLSDGQIATIGAWADAGAPEGNPGSAVPTPAALPTLSQVSATLAMDQSYTPPAGQTDEYRCFVADPGIATDQFLVGYDVKPGQPQEVHHVVLYAVLDSAGDAQAAANDANDPGPGYECFGGPGVSHSQFVAAWAPGTGAVTFPATTGIALKAHRKIVMQVHYNEVNGVTADQSTVDLELQPTVATPGAITMVGANNFTIPGNSVDYEVDAAAVAPVGGKVWMVFPHMHLHGTKIDVALTHAGSDSCMIDVPTWNFHWQGLYPYADGPLQVSAGDTITVHCHYDTQNSGNVSQGEGTEDEMCLTGFFVTP